MAALSSDDLPVEHCRLHTPPLAEVGKVLAAGLAANFAAATVEVVDCPDLTADEWGLASAGIGGQTRLLDIGGVPYLVPLVDRSRIYDMRDYPRLTGLSDGGLVLGAGAGPFPHINRNCEMMPNLYVRPDRSIVQRTHISRTYDEDGSYGTELLPETESRNAVLGNIFVSEGKPGKVLKVHCKGRTGFKNLVSCMRESLAAHYGDEVVGMGGVFKVVAGQVWIHVMPDFSPCPLETDADVEGWLNFYTMSAPFVCLPVFISKDPGQDLRVEHTHGWGKDGQGGHYHHDTTPEEVEYLGYFNLAEFSYRADRPKTTHMVGRD